MRRIGIDVGGTNTDAALLDGTQMVASIKTPHDIRRADWHPERPAGATA